MFVDEVDIHVEAGNGGKGCLAFRREKFVPRGGPSGGDGGHGGSVYVVASPHVNTLINFRFHPEFSAERGEHGMGSNRTGHGGADLELAVPIGTLVYEKTSDPEHPLNLIADLATEVETARLLTLQAAYLKDTGRPAMHAAAMAKLFASETAMKAASKAVQIHGGAGYITEFPVERIFRDAKLTEIGEGTSEIQRMVIAREILQLG